LLIADRQLQRYFGALVTEYSRAPVQQRLAFLASLDSALQVSKEERKVISSLFSHRNRLAHSSLAYRELRYLPDDESSWSKLTDFERFPKRGVLEYRGWDGNILEHAESYYSCAEKLIRRFEAEPLIGEEKNEP
jgi:hypothetical protein